jgi:DNA-binding transcriptional LysR family regulator
MPLTFSMRGVHDVFELRRLRYLVTLAVRLSYSRAAEDLGISQSALTRAIQSLEAEMGMRLFDRDQAGVTPTEQGRRVVEMAEALLTHAKDFEHQVTLTSRGREGRISFGMSRFASSALLPATLASRVSSAPAFAHQVLVRPPEQLWHLLTAREIEFFVSEEWQSPDLLPVRSDVVGEFPVSLIVRRLHPLIRGHGDWQGLPMIVTSSVGLSSEIVSILLERTRTAIQMIEDLAAAEQLVRHTDLIWITSKIALIDKLADGSLAELSWPSGLTPGDRKLVMYSLERRSQAPATVELRAAFRRHLRQLS